MLTHLDLFSGIGGFSLGLERTGGFKTVAFCEQDAFCQRVLEQHWPGVPIHGDIRELTADAVGPVDIVTGGFPCQPWSVAGRQRGAEDDRDLWPEMARIVSLARPRWVVGENVPGLAGAPLGLDRVLSDLEGLGYACQTFDIPACAVDAPQRRRRLWIVAHAERVARRPGEPAGHQPDGQGAGRAQEAGGSGGGGAVGGAVAHAEKQRLEIRRDGRVASDAQQSAAVRTSPLGDADPERQPQPGRREREGGRRPGDPGPRDGGFWDDAEWIVGGDGKARRVGPGLRLLASGLPNRVAKLRAFGNAVVPQVVEVIGRAILEAEAEPMRASCVQVGDG